ncbi:MAG TPA: LysR substrate-binding domain-containing protein [Pseudonocardiaceae bacterium]|jgi:DNA-binding transcriptional LysR family regulator|nr:LysR substrate-binding domain-containing protein [Pseudonocardiaceae bacterium]
MELRHLVSFLAVAEERHFGRAAARLHLAQPSLSQQIQRLERTVGVTLVERTSHQVRLTPAGEVLRELARNIVAQVEEATTAVREVALGRAGTLRVGYNFLAGQKILPTALARMNSMLPNVEVTLVENRTGPQLDALSHGALDVALVYGRPSAIEFRSRPLVQVPLVAVVGRGHSWAGRSRISFSELAGQRCILFDRQQSPAMHDAIMTAAERSGIRLSVEYRLDDPNATAIMVSVKPVVGFASAPRAVSSAAVPGYAQTAMVALHDPVPTIDLYAVWRADDARPLVQAMLKCIESVKPVDLVA